MPQLRDILHEVESYPQPLAAAIGRYLGCAPADLGSRNKMLVDLFELFLKFLSIVQLQECVQQIPGFTGQLPLKEKTFEFLQHPPLGKWMELLRLLCTLDLDPAVVPVTAAIADWFKKPGNAASAEALKMLKNLSTAVQITPSDQPYESICNGLVTYRNKHIAHGPQSQPGELERCIQTLDACLACLLQSAEFLKSIGLFYTESVNKAEGGRFNAQTINLRGTFKAQVMLQTSADLDYHELYVQWQPGGSSEAAFVRVGPFLLWHLNADSKHLEVYVFNYAMRSSLEYVSYASGAHYHHKELHQAFKDLLNLSLQPDVDEEERASLSADERARRANEHCNRGLNLVREGKLEDALLEFERSVQYLRDPMTYLQMAKVQQELKDPPAAILATLRQCLDLEPENSDARAMAEELEALLRKRSLDGTTAADEEGSPATVEWAGTDLSHALAPRRYREYAWLFWSVAMVLYYGVSSMIEFGAGQPIFVASLAGMCVCNLVFTNGLVSARSLLLWLQGPLKMQVDNMKPWRFNAWYVQQCNGIFGDNVIVDGKFRLLATIRRERAYWLGLLAWMLALGVLIFIGTDSHRLAPLLVMKRAVDYFFIIFWLYPCVRFIIMTTGFIYQYSRLSLKPMLTRMNDEGMRSLGALMSFNIYLASTAFTAYFLPASFTHRAAIRSDIVVLSLITAIVLVWSIGMPLMVRRAARRSKGKAVQAYSSHIERAFDNFLKTPNDQTLKLYQWLTANERVLQKIGTWPLTFRQTAVLVVGSNLLLLVLCAHYIIHRYQMWPIIFHKLGWTF